MLAKWDERYTAGTIALWNEWAVKDGYKEMTEERFTAVFRSNPYFDGDNTFVWLEDGIVQGFACGCTGDDLPLGDVAGYITCIVLPEHLRSDDRFFAMLEALESRFKEKGKRQSEVLFFNPMHLPWYIPDTPRHEHNNAPGVPLGSALHAFLLRQGYAERAVENAMYLPLGGFDVPDDIRLKEEKAALSGYSVELLDTARHCGLSDMLNALGNPLWQKEISRCAAEGVPVVIAAQHGEAVGFAGPVIREESGRGYFAGIGVHPDHEGHGLGTILFFRLCEAFQSIGADYMSLYTGSTNPALRIYEKAGFHTVKQFAVMRKEI